MIPLSTQTTAPGSTETVAGIVLCLGLIVAVVLSTTILLKGVQGYRRAHNPALLGLSIGIVFLSGIPIITNITLSTFALLDTDLIRIFANGFRLVGLGIVLYVIYGTRGDNQ